MQMNYANPLRDPRSHSLAILTFSRIIHQQRIPGNKMICNMCGNQFKSQKTLTQHNKDVQIEKDLDTIGVLEYNYHT